MVAWLASHRRLAIAALVVGIAALGLLVANRLQPDVRTAMPEASGSPTASPAPTPTSAPSLVAPLPGAPEDRPLPPCDDGVVPEPATTAVVQEPRHGPVSLELVGQLGGSADAATLDGSRLLVGVGSRVMELDVTDPAFLREVAVSEPLGGKVSALAVADDVTVAGLAEAGIAVLDTAEGVVEVTGTLPMPGYVEGVTIRGSIAFVSDGPGGLRIVDLTDLAQPREVAAAHDLHRIMDTALSGDRAYLAAADEGVVVLDIGDLTAPQQIGALFTGGYASGIAIDGTSLFVADGWGGLRVVDVATPAAPRLVTTTPTLAWMTGVEVGPGLAYVAAGSDGLRLLDITDPGQPSEVGLVSLTGGLAVTAAVSGELAAVTDALHRVSLIDIGEPSEPVVLSTVAPFGTAQGIAVIGDTAFLAARDQGLRVIDISNPAQPREDAAIVTEDLVQAVAAVGSNVFFATIPHPGGAGLHSIFGLYASGGDPIEPELPVADGNVVGMAASGSSLLMGIEGGLQVIHGGEPAPCLLGYLQTFEDGLSEATGVTAAGSHAYVAVEETGIYVVDIENPMEPALAGHAPLPDTFKGIHATLAAGSTLYAIGTSHFGQEVVAYDISSPTEPRLLGTLVLPVPTLANAEDGVQPLAYADGHLFVADAGAGLIVVDVSAPPNLAVVGQLRLPGRAASVVTAEGLAYVASHDGGLSVVRWTDGAAIPPVSDPIMTTASLSGGSAGVVDIGLSASGDCVVTSTEDSASGSLRDCLGRTSTGDTIRFDPNVFPPGQPTSIALESTLPWVADGVTLDGIGAGVVLDGGGEVDEGLHVANETTIQGMTVIGFLAAGIYIDGAGNTVAGNVISGNPGAGLVIQGDENRIVGNLIGPERSGMTSLGAQEIGVELHGIGNVIGGAEAGDRNVIGGSRTEVWVKETQGNTIEGNYIGTDISSTGLLRPPDWNRTMYFEFGAGANFVARNVIGGGVLVGPTDPGSSYNTFVGNHIGVDASGTKALPCECSGLAIGGYTRIGGTLPGEGNTIYGGIDIVGTDVVVLGNRVGLDVNGRPFVDPQVSVLLHTARRNVIGGRAVGAANVIAGLGIRIVDEAQANFIVGNTIGAAAQPIEADLTVARAGWNHIVANLVEHGAAGLILQDGAYLNRIRGNVFRHNEVGVVAADSTGNLVAANAFLDNGLAASDNGSVNRWDDGTRGNFWSDHHGTDADGDGLIDDPRSVPPNGRDDHPLLHEPSGARALHAQGEAATPT